jgi:hypothetical protein
MEAVEALALVAGHADEELLLRNEYLAAENEIPRSELSRRPQLTNPERVRLAKLGKRLGLKALNDVAAIVKPETILTWCRKLAAKKFDGTAKRRESGRPRVDEEVERPVLRMVEEKSRSCGRLSARPDERCRARRGCARPAAEEGACRQIWRFALQQTIGFPSRTWDSPHDAACQSCQTPSQCAVNVEIFIIFKPFRLIRFGPWNWHAACFNTVCHNGVREGCFHVQIIPDPERCHSGLDHGRGSQGAVGGVARARRGST